MTDIRIVDCHVDLAGEDPYGQLTGGHITVEGLIAPLLIKTSKKYTTSQRSRHSDYLFALQNLAGKTWVTKDFTGITATLIQPFPNSSPYMCWVPGMKAIWVGICMTSF